LTRAKNLRRLKAFSSRTKGDPLTSVAQDRELGRQGSLQDLRPDDDPTDDSAKPSLKNLGAKVQAVKAFGSLQKARWSSAPSITGMMSQGESPERAHPKHPDSPESTPEAGNSPGKSPGDCDRVVSVSFSREGRYATARLKHPSFRMQNLHSETKLVSFQFVIITMLLES
jgi:hypothetical protein